jgi:hypothetical protein
MHLLAKAVEAWRVCVADIALQVILARKRWHRVGRLAGQECKRHSAECQTDEQAPEHGSPSLE